MLSLDLSPETLEANGFGEPFSVPAKPCFEAGDVSDCFYNFQIHQLSSWFAFDDRFSVQHLWDNGFNFDKLFDDVSQRDEPVCGSDMVYPCFGGLPMGWSWALFLANESIVHQTTASRDVNTDDVIRDRSRAPDVLPDRPAVGVYVDNIHVFAGSMGGGPLRECPRSSSDLLSWGFPSSQIMWNNNWRPIVWESLSTSRPSPSPDQNIRDPGDCGWLFAKS